MHSGKTYIKVIEIQLLQRLIQGLLHILRTVAVAPQLGGDEDVLTLQAGNILVGPLDALADLTLVGICRSGIDVPVAVLERDLDGLLDRAGLRLPGACARGASAGARARGRAGDSPKPSVGICAPVLSLTNFVAGMVGVVCAMERWWVVRKATGAICAGFWYVVGRQRAQDYATAYQ